MGEGDIPVRVILVVEDLEWIRRGMVREVERRGYRALEAADDEEALFVADGMRPDLVLTEEELPTLDSLAKRFSEHPELGDVPIAIVNPDEEEGTLYGRIVVLTEYEQIARLLFSLDALPPRITNFLRVHTRAPSWTSVSAHGADIPSRDQCHPSRREAETAQQVRETGLPNGCRPRSGPALK